MLVTQAIRKYNDSEQNRVIDYLFIEWYQTKKRVQRLVTSQGNNIAIRFLGKGQELQQNDVLYEDDHRIVVVSILPCESIEIKTTDFITLSLLAYEIGNKHWPLFVENNNLYMPYERVIYDWLQKIGFDPIKIEKQLCFPLNANVDFDQHKKFSFTPPKGGLSLKL